MCALIQNPTKCEQDLLIRFLHAENVTCSEIHCGLQNVYSLWKWCKNVCDEEQPIHPSVITKEIIDLVKEITINVRQLVCCVRVF